MSIFCWSARTCPNEILRLLLLLEAQLGRKINPNCYTWRSMQNLPRTFVNRVLPSEYAKSEVDAPAGAG